jgi:beta-carotene 3-hydroxylase
MFATMVMTALAVGFNVDGYGWLIGVCVGVTAYGIVYGFVHDLYAHRRFRIISQRIGCLEHLAEAHQIHHRFGGEPYGMLLPIGWQAARRAGRARLGANSAVG